MRIHLVKESTIRDYMNEQSGSNLSFNEWLSKCKLANWQRPGDIKFTFPQADLLGRGSNRVIFNIAGNRYRMICKYAFGESEVHLFICWIGTHDEYDILCRQGNQYIVSNY